MSHLSRALHLPALRVAVIIGFSYVVILAALAGVVGGGVGVVRPEGKIDPVNGFRFCETFEIVGRKPSRRKPLPETRARLLLCDRKRQHSARRENRIRRLRLSHDLHATEFASSRDLRWHEDRLRAATLTLHFECVVSELLHLFRTNPEVLLVRLLFNQL